MSLMQGRFFDRDRRWRKCWTWWTGKRHIPLWPFPRYQLYCWRGRDYGDEIPHTDTPHADMAHADHIDAPRRD